MNHCHNYYIFWTDHFDLVHAFLNVGSVQFLLLFELLLFESVQLLSLSNCLHLLQPIVNRDVRRIDFFSLSSFPFFRNEGEPFNTFVLILFYRNLKYFTFLGINFHPILGYPSPKNILFLICLFSIYSNLLSIKSCKQWLFITCQVFFLETYERFWYTRYVRIASERLTKLFACFTRDIRLPIWYLSFFVYLYNKTTCYAGGSPYGFSPR